MFKRSIQVSVIKDKKIKNNDTVDQPFISKDEARAIVKDMMKWTAITIVGVVAASVALHTAGEIIIRSLEEESKKEEE